MTDETPPTVKDCPKDIVKTTDRIAEVISWKEPQFSDNVAIRHIMNPVRKSGQSWYPGEDILMQYIATDIAGNQVKCSFNVAVKCKYSMKVSSVYRGLLKSRFETNANKLCNIVNAGKRKESAKRQTLFFSGSFLVGLMVSTADMRILAARA